MRCSTAQCSVCGCHFRPCRCEQVQLQQQWMQRAKYDRQQEMIQRQNAQQHAPLQRERTPASSALPTTDSVPQTQPAASVVRVTTVEALFSRSLPPGPLVLGGRRPVAQLQVEHAPLQRARTPASSALSTTASAPQTQPAASVVRVTTVEALFSRSLPPGPPVLGGRRPVAQLQVEHAPLQRPRTPASSALPTTASVPQTQPAASVVRVTTVEALFSRSLPPGPPVLGGRRQVAQLKVEHAQIQRARTAASSALSTTASVPQSQPAASVVLVTTVEALFSRSLPPGPPVHGGKRPATQLQVGLQQQQKLEPTPDFLDPAWISPPLSSPVNWASVGPPAYVPASLRTQGSTSNLGQSSVAQHGSMSIPSYYPSSLDQRVSTAAYAPASLGQRGSMASLSMNRFGGGSTSIPGQASVGQHGLPPEFDPPSLDQHGWSPTLDQSWLDRRDSAWLGRHTSRPDNVRKSPSPGRSTQALGQSLQSQQTVVIVTVPGPSSSTQTRSTSFHDPSSSSQLWSAPFLDPFSSTQPSASFHDPFLSSQPWSMPLQYPFSFTQPWSFPSYYPFSFTELWSMPLHGPSSVSQSWSGPLQHSFPTTQPWSTPFYDPSAVQHPPLSFHDPTQLAQSGVVPFGGLIHPPLGNGLPSDAGGEPMYRLLAGSGSTQILDPSSSRQRWPMPVLGTGEAAQRPVAQVAHQSTAMPLHGLAQPPPMPVDDPHSDEEVESALRLQPYNPDQND